MRKFFALFLLVAVGASSCQTKCPAYSATKPATRTAAPAMATSATTAPDRQ
ncbi:hypothetical protein [Hymenobacter weizhouensis]|uniref:hypothetical protein n=1 Tax=Hymenobacter sp. YIM 151500-1 TaxID=2987689 RepID=UPI0022279922|nr:hypothetical protein [Hymenobacter sp. YIM 151500-1]UYZ63482.1 hypothetical protein OIS53_01245 [Hymenobacter sp. YIM 151500-1]